VQVAVQAAPAPAVGVSAGVAVAIVTMPESFGCTPSDVSAAGSPPVHWSTTVTGDAAVVVEAAHAGIAASRSTVRCAHSAHALGATGMILATRIFIAGLSARIWPTSVVQAARICAVDRLLHTPFVPKCITTMWRWVAASHPTS
jgi:hypothetical protein